MNLEHMLHRCRRDQWRIDALDWTRHPRPMTRDEETAIVQYLTDMAAIERLAGALFAAQGARTSDPRLKEIFESFVVDEERHARTAERLARHYDVHHYRPYRTNPRLEKFAPHFVNAVRFLSAEVANLYVTTGELILDIALLRSLNDYVHDDMLEQAMALINRDESRHVAIDFYMVELYASPAYQAMNAAETPQPLLRYVQAWWAFLHVLYHARPFLREIFVQPMERTDPSGRRLREAMKRIQLLGTRPDVQRRPFARFLLAMRDVAMHPVLGPVLGGMASRLAGVPVELLVNLYNDEERRRASRMSMDALTEEALAAKTWS